MTKRLVWMSDSPTIETGYSNISKQICNRLAAKGWEVHFFAHNYVGQTLPPGLTFQDGTKLDFTVWGRGRNDYCQDVLSPRLKEIKPQVFVTLLDTFMVYPWFAEHDFSPAKPVFYFPSDGGGGLPLNCEHILSRMSVPVAMSKFAQKQAKEYHNLDCKYIPHAVDHEVYKPLSPEEKFLCKARWGMQSKFVVGVVARNQPRKMLDRTLKALADFVKDKPDVVLFMHTDREDAAAMIDLNVLVQRYKLWNRVVYSGTKFYKGFDYLAMNTVYNAMDVFFLSTSGEGWGVPTIEAMSCEIPVVATDYTTTQEIVKNHGAGFGVNLTGCGEYDYLSMDLREYDQLVSTGTVTGSWAVERGVMDIGDAVKKLTLLYNDAELRKTMGSNGRKAVLEEYSWDVVAEQWDKLLSELVEW